ncbi:Protein-lysine N-methyltransferase efm6 [Hypoxylon texense]
MVGRCKRALAIGAAAAATLAGAAPIDYFPINSQLPPVARISEAFEFTFSPLTFFSPTNITYRLENAPKWLSIDSSSRRLYGTPSDDDVPPGEVVGIPIELVAEDKTGSTTTRPTLVVSRNPPPEVAVPIAEQLPKFGTYIAPSSLHLHPSKPFSFTFAEDTFRTANGNSGLNLYALTGDNTPLPSWISFDSEKLSFSGETPSFESLIQPPQTFTFQLVASDVVGFASVSASFSLVVGSHELTADPSVVKLNATPGKPLVYEDLPDVLKLDKKPVKPEDVKAISALDLPSWLSFDNKTWKLDGTPDSTAESTNITITILDKFTDTLNLTVSIKFGLFVSDLPDLNLVSGSEFSFDLKKYLSNASDITVTVDDDPNAPWAEFNSSSLILSGTVPKPMAAKSESASRVAFKAASKHTSDTETKSMNIHVASTPPSSTISPTPSAEPKDANDEGPNKNLLWLLIIPISLTFIGIIALLFYIRRQRQHRAGVSIHKVSGPIPGSFVFNRPDSPGKGSGYAGRQMLDIGPPRPSNSSISAQNSGASAAVSNQQSSQATSSLVGNPAPHAMMSMYSAARSPAHSDIMETASSWSAGQRSQLSPQVSRTDEVSLLSDTSLGSGDAYIAEARAYSIIRTPRSEVFRSLQVPQNSEPFSIQNTPEIAYTTAERYDSSSDNAVPPAVGYAVRPTPSPRQQQEQDSGLGIRGVGQRLSNLWKRQSGNPVPDERKRQSILSDATGQTTRTSILTSGISGVGEEEATTSTNTVARPTIIHIPSRPGEVRQMSRNSRLGDSSPLFSARSATKSPPNFGLITRSPEPIDESPELPPTLEDPSDPRESDSSWDRLARNSLGIAYKDLIITEPKKAAPGREPLAEVIYEDNWIKHEIDRDLLSPDQWLQPSSTSVNVNMVGIANTSPANTSSELPRLPPTSALATPKGGKAGFEHRPSRNAGNILYHTPSISSRSDGSSSVRTQIAVGSENRALASATPSTENSSWGPPNRPLPETPSSRGPGRVPLADRPNGSSYYNYNPNPSAHSIGTSGIGEGDLPTPKSKKSWKTTRSMKSAKSLRSVWADEDDEDDDVWEDVRPRTIVDDWDDGLDSDGSFAVYI